MEEEIKRWNPKGGRPKKEEKEQYNSWITVRVTAQEKEDFENEVKEAGYTKVAVYARQKLLAKDARISFNPQVLFKTLNELNPELSKVGNNINQIARYVNYLDKNNMVDQKFIAEYNQYFKKMTEIQHEYTLAIRAYLKTLTPR